MFSCLPFLGALCGNCGNRCKNSRFKQKSGQNTTGDYLIYEKFWDQTFKRPPEKIEYTENTEIGQKLHQTAAKRQTFSRNGSKLDQNHRKVLKVFEQFIGVPFNFFCFNEASIFFVFSVIFPWFHRIFSLFQWIYRAADGIKIINQLDDEIFTTVINYVHKNMPPNADATDTDDDGGLEK